MSRRDYFILLARLKKSKGPKDQNDSVYVEGRRSIFTASMSKAAEVEVSSLRGQWTNAINKTASQKLAWLF